VTIGDETFPLERPFMVMATQNPLEQEGTYPLPEAQVDRFMLHVRVEYPSREHERKVMERMSQQLLRDGATDEDSTTPFRATKVITPRELMQARRVVGQVYVDEKIKDYIIDVVLATRDPKRAKLNDLSDMIAHGGSPRASIALNMAARAHAFLRHRGFVTPEDVKAVGPDVLRHRIIRTYEAEAEEISSEHIVRRIFDAVEVP
jgi:MoxR-like ATPase